MALRFTDAATLIRIVQSSTQPFTVGMWYRRPTSAGGFAADSTIISAFGYGAVHDATSIVARVEFTASPPSPVVQPAAGEWVYLAISNDGGNYSIRAFADTAGQSVSALGADWKPQSVANIEIGDIEGAFGSGLSDATHCHLRVWSSILSDAQLNTEKNSATPVITSGLISACPLTANLTATHGTNATAAVGSGYEFIADLPLVLSGGGSTAPEITDAGDETLLAGETNFPISGANFGASQGSNGAVFISPTNNSADAGRVQQTVTSWADGTVQITAVQGSLPAATNLYLFVRNDAGQFNATGYVVQFLAVPAITNAGDELHENGEVVLVQGNNFGASQGANGKVYLSPTNNVSDGSRVEQTVNSWSNTGIEITVVKGGLSFLTQLYLFVLTNGGASNANGYAMQIEPKLYLRDKLVTLTEAPRANETGLTLLVWRQLPTAASPNPSQAIGSLSSDANGDIDWRIARGSLGVGAPVWASVLKDGDPAIATMRKMIPVAE